VGRILVITGMHRSGTSMVAHYLQCCGFEIGKELLPADKGNPKGYYEDSGILELHRQMLASFGLTTFPTSHRQIAKEVPAQFRTAAEGIIAKKNSSPYWGWKEPRTSLFLDFWKQIIPEMNNLFLLRNPIFVADSLIRRGTDGEISRRPVTALGSWLLHNQCILRFYQQHREKAFLVGVNDFVHRPKHIVPLLFSKLKIDLPIMDFDAVYEPGSFEDKISARHIKILLRYPFHATRCLIHYQRMKRLADWRLLAPTS
jgi:hypothetical protein